MIALEVFLLFAGLSLLALGGGSAVIPEMYAQALQRGWLSARQFADFYAITQVTPGPGMMLVTLIGYQAAGYPGALCAAVGMFGPSSLMVLAARHGWGRLQNSRWRPLLERSTRPLAVGTMLASATLVARVTNTDAQSWTITLAAALLVGSQRLAILPTMALAALAGILFAGN